MKIYSVKIYGGAIKFTECNKPQNQKVVQDGEAIEIHNDEIKDLLDDMVS